MILKILIAVAVFVLGLLGYAATRPGTFSVQRSVTVNAPSERIFVLINDFRNWESWAPQDREDSSVKRTFSGPASGEGAASEWDSTGSAGKGRMSITESVPTSRIRIQVDFAKPFEAHNVNEFDLQPAGPATKVTWVLTAENLYVMKVMSIFVNMERPVGKHLEKGLTDLKAAAEK